MKMNRHIAGGLILLAGLSLFCSTARADVYLPNGNSRNAVPTITTADEAVKSLPILSKIPTSFFVGDGFKFKLSGMELRIDHMGTHSRAPVSKRNCMIGFSYATPVSFFGSRIDIPLFHAENLTMADWGMNTLGDYVLRFSKDAAVAHPVLGLSGTVRF